MMIFGLSRRSHEVLYMSFIKHKAWYPFAFTLHYLILQNLKKKLEAL